MIDALRSVGDGSRDADCLNDAVVLYKNSEERSPEGDVRWGFDELLEALVHAVRWADAAWRAEPDSERHATAARLRATALLSAASERWPDALLVSAAQLAELTDHGAPARVAHRLSQLPLPARVTGLFRQRDISGRFREEDSQDPITPAVALLIRLYGEPVMRPTVLQPGALHSFEVEARVSQWPEDAHGLEVSFLSVHPRDFLYASAITFAREMLTQPLEIRVAGSRPPNDPPLGLTARATFLCHDSRRDALLTGNTTLELVTFDPRSATPLNMPTAAFRLQQMMTELSNALPHLSAEDRRDARLLLEGVLRFAHTALDDRMATVDDIDEAWFQGELKYFLQADSAIGARLVDRVGRAGGITDLVLGNVVLELKAEKQTPLSLNDAKERYVRQPTQYASAGDSPVSLLAVLDASPKRAPAGVMGNELGWAYPEVASGPEPLFPSLVGVVVVRTGFPRPSDFSRRV